MKLPVVMPSNQISLASRLMPTYPDRLGMLFGFDGWVNPRGLPYALDNGRFPVWSKGIKWDESKFEELIVRSQSHDYQPIWLAVPDVVADADATFREWGRWSKPLSRFGWPLALVVQDGMGVSDVRRVRPRPDLIFVGGTNRFKWRTMPLWVANFPRVHVGRVNTGRQLWTCHFAGVESSDGTGWWHRKQFAQLEAYLRLSTVGEVPTGYRGLF
jgi:hypothetical protein